MLSIRVYFVYFITSVYYWPIQEISISLKKIKNIVPRALHIQCNMHDTIIIDNHINMNDIILYYNIELCNTNFITSGFFIYTIDVFVQYDK